MLISTVTDYNMLVNITS